MMKHWFQCWRLWPTRLRDLFPTGKRWLGQRTASESDALPPIRPTSVGFLLVQTFSIAKMKQQALHEAWTKISHKIGSRLPTSLLSNAVQREGDVDLVLRCLENEYVARTETGTESGIFEFHYQYMLSVYWIGGMYETFALLRRRKLADQSRIFEEILNDLEIARVTLEKHEIAKDRNLDNPLPMTRAPANNDASDYYSYDPKDNLRAHIMPSGLSMRGSVMWSVLDVKKDAMRRIERRDLSDRILALWA